MIKNVVIGQLFLKENEGALFSLLKNKDSFVVSNLIFERKLFFGFEEVEPGSTLYLSAPSIGSYPNNVKKCFLHINDDEKNKIFYSRYLLFYIIKNHSKQKGLISAFNRSFVKSSFSSSVNVFVTELHHPYIETAFYIKKFLAKRGINAVICQMAPDLPINVYDEKRKNNIIYKLLKQHSYKRLLQKMDKIDKFVLFTEPMNEILNPFGKDYIVIPGIQDVTKDKHCVFDAKTHFKLLFSAKLQKKNGILLALNAMEFLPKDKFELIVAGFGEEKDMVLSFSNKNDNIKYVGYITPDEVKNLQKQCDILLSLRLPSWKGVDYSFPSKFFEAISSGKPVVTFKLRTYDEQIDSFAFYAEQETPSSLAKAILKASACNSLDSIFEKEIEFLSKYSPRNIVNSIISLCSRK